MSQRGTATPIDPAMTPPPSTHIGGWLLATAIGLLLAMQIHDWWNPAPDAVGYLSIARSVWSGHGLTNLGSPHLHYAPGYPLLMSPVFLTADPFLWLSIARFIFAALTLWAAYQWAKEIVPRPGPLFVVAGTACNVSFWVYYRTPLSDLPMMMWMFWAALAMRKALAARGGGRISGWCVAAALLMVAASVTRQAAIVTADGMIAVAVHDARCRRISWLRVIGVSGACLLPAALAVVGLVAYEHATASPGPSQTYLAQLQPTLQSPLMQIAVGLHLRIGEVGRLLIPGMFATYGKPTQWLDPNLIIYLPVTVLVAIGWWKTARLKADALLWSMPLYVGLYVLWPFDQGTRFLMPLLPVLLVCCWPWLARLRRGRSAVLAALCVAHLAVATVRWVMETRRDGAEYRTAVPALTALSHDLPPGSGPVVVSGIPGDGNSVQWFEFLADRRLIPVNPADAANFSGGAGDVEFLLQPLSAPLPPHFAPWREAGAFGLARRAP